MKRHEEIPRLVHALLELCALCVPPHLRAQWQEEWIGEFVAARRRPGRTRGALLVAGAVTDAFAIRRYAGVRDVDDAGQSPASVAVLLLHSVKHATRSLTRAPGFALVAVLTLTIGVGATTAVFSVVHGVLLRPLPYDDAGDVVVLRQTDTRDGSTRNGVSAANLRDVAAGARTLEHVSGAATHGFTLLEDGRAHSLRGWLVTEGFFEAVGGRALLGRTFLPEEYQAGNERVVVLGHETWRTRFGARPDVIGRMLTLDGVAHRVVGVLPAAFAYPSAAQIWAPRTPQAWDEEVRGGAQLDAVGRVVAGATQAQVSAELERLAGELAARHRAANANVGLRTMPLREHLFGDVRAPLLLVSGAVLLVLLITVSNVAGLQLARGAVRAREYALRRALGADTGSIVRQVAAEGLVLAAVGCAGGIAVAHIAVQALRVLAPIHLPRIDELRIDAAVVAFAVAVATASALLASVVPALRAARARGFSRTLASGSRTVTTGVRAHRARDRLVIAEIALALVLSVGAGLLLRSYRHVLANEPGFEPERRLAVQVFAYDDNDEPDLTFARRVREEILAIPGVQAVGLTTAVPFADNATVWAMHGTARFSLGVEADETREARIMAVDAGYPAAMGIEVLAGRAFALFDERDAPAVSMVNDAFVRRFFADRDPVGARISTGGGAQAREIVGVLADVRTAGLESEPEPEIYVPFFQTPPTGGITLVVRTAMDADGLLATVQEAVWKAKPAQSIWAARPLSALLDDWSRERRFITTLLLAFATLSVGLAAIGIFGLLTFTVAQRTRELGVRRALGAPRGAIVAIVVRDGLSLAVTGAALGAVGAAALSRLLEGLLFGVQPLDPLTFAATAGFILAVTLLAAALPALRAARADPLVALRQE